MNTIAAVVACSTSNAHTLMAAEALKKTAEILGYAIYVEIHGETQEKHCLSDDILARADCVIIAADEPSQHLERFAGKPLYCASLSQAIRETVSVIEAASAEGGARGGLQKPLLTESEKLAIQTTPATKKLVAVTACPTGIAHTFMAAEALQQSAARLGYEIKVETQGSVGAKNTLLTEEIAQADAVVIAADTFVDLSRFIGKRVYRTSTTKALKAGQDVIVAALAAAPVLQQSSSANVHITPKNPTQSNTKHLGHFAGPYRHLLTGVSYMLPVVVAGGLIIALSFAFGLKPLEGTLGAVLLKIGAGAAFKLIIPLLAGYIAFSIADRPGLAPGLIGGVIAADLGTGFLGGILAGFLAGYGAKLLRDRLKVPSSLEGLKPVLIIPVLATLGVGLIMHYLLGKPVAALMTSLTLFLQDVGQTNASILGFLLGGMMAVDMGGPINKAAYTFAVGLLSSHIEQPIAAVMAAGMTPPLGLALATLVMKSRFSEEERQAGRASVLLGLSFITESAIPFAAKDPTRVLPACMMGSALAGGLSMAFGCTLKAPHGGIFVLAIPKAVGHGLWYIGAIAAGTAVTALLVVLFKGLKK